jgi:hypothetical protein
MATDVPQTVEEFIALDKNSERVPIARTVVVLKSFDLNPKFERGEIDFWFPPGTEVWDGFAKRVYLMGDTLEMLREKVAPAKAPGAGDE